MATEIDHIPPLDEAVELMLEYFAALPFPLPDDDEWLAALPGDYTLLVARVDDAPAGVVALRPLGDGGEIKRMFVRDAFRGRGIARSLVDECIALARAAGYARLRLDTHSSLIPAQRLYESFGFTQIPPYWDHPIPDVLFYELRLT